MSPFTGQAAWHGDGAWMCCGNAARHVPVLNTSVVPVVQMLGTAVCRVHAATLCNCASTQPVALFAGRDVLVVQFRRLVDQRAGQHLELRRLDRPRQCAEQRGIDDPSQAVAARDRDAVDRNHPVARQLLGELLAASSTS